MWVRVVTAAVRMQRSARTYLTRQFARHGSHISRHQTRTILLCNLVIASLFYPAVVMYLLTTSEDASSSFTPECHERHRVHDNNTAACVLGARAPTNIWDVARASLADITGGGRVNRSDANYPVHDLHLLWDETPSLEVVPRPAQAEGVPTVRMEQVLLTTETVRQGDGSPYGMLEPHALLAAQQVQHDIEARMRTANISCYELDGACLVLSPLTYWPTAADIQADEHPAKSYTGSPVRAVVTPPVAPLLANTSIPLLYSTTLASRWPYLPLFSRAEFLVLSFFVHDSPGTAKAWERLVHDVASAQHLVLERPPGIEAGDTYLRFKPQHLTARPTLNVSVVAGGYMLLLLFIFRGLVQMRRLHSRFGIAFTGSVQLLLDLIMSLSVCALLGIRLNAVPWSILPFIIVVVGSESMLFMIRTITNTPLSLTMHARIAYGLSQVAGPITLTALSDIVLLVLLAWTVRIPAVLQFCLFTICTLVVDYFMQMTFFVTVLSIDMQRLELAEVLLQAPTAAPATPAAEPGMPPVPPAPYRPRSVISYVLGGMHALLHTRGVRSFRVSVLATAVLTPVLYYASDGKVAQFFARLLSSPFATVAAEPHVAPTALHDNPYGMFWASINPLHAPLVQMRVAPWSVLTLPQAALPANARTPPGPWLEQLFFHRQGATLFLVFLFVVCPVAATMLVMSGVLRYLRKDTDLLESQHEKSDGTDAGLSALLPQPSRSDASSLRVHVEVLTDALHAAPVHLVGATGAWVVSADICNQLRATNDERGTSCALASLRMDAGAAPDGSRLSALYVHDLGNDEALVCLGQASGRVSVVHLPSWRLVMDVHRGPDGPLAPVQDVTVRHATLLTLHRDGAWLAWRDLAALAHKTAEPSSVLPYRLTTCLASDTAWTAVPLAQDDDALGAVSAQGDLVVARVVPPSSEQRLSVDVAARVQTRAVCRCALLLAAETDGTSTPPAPPIVTPPRQALAPRRAEWLVAGDQDGVLHLWLGGHGAPVASLPLAEPCADGAVHAIQRVSREPSAPLLLVTTANRVWFVGVHASAPHLVLLHSWANARGVADVLPFAPAAPAWVLGVRRAVTTHTDRSAARWEVWRMRLPSTDDAAPTQKTTHLEAMPLPLEQLIGASVDARLADASAEPLAQRPLLAARLSSMVRVDAPHPQWMLPYGSCLIAVSTS